MIQPIIMVSAKLLTAALAAALPASALPNFVKRENAASPQTITVTIPAQPTETGPAVYDWTKGGVKEFTIHQSCNATERVQLRQGLNEAIAVATHARDHILRFGNSSDFYRKYFGKAPTGEPIGWLDKLINGDKNGLIFRCDDIDGNCKQDGKLDCDISTTSPTTVWFAPFYLPIPLTNMSRPQDGEATGEAPTLPPRLSSAHSPTRPASP